MDEAVSFWGDYNNINNTGTITADNIGLDTLGASADIINSGTIQGNRVGISVEMTSSSDDTYIGNSGLVRGESAIMVVSSDKPLSQLTVRNSGTLDGVVNIQNAVVDFRNTGNIFGDVELPAGSYFVNRGTIKGLVSIAGPSGSLINTGAIDGDVCTGSTPFDGRRGTVTGTITGASGLDVIRAGNDGERIAGGKGHGRLFGGAGPDTFIFFAHNAVDSDTIVGFNVGNDTIELSHSGFGVLAIDVAPVFAIGAAATSAADHLFYNPTSGGVYFDIDGSGAIPADLLATLAPGLKLAANNFSVV